MKDYFKEIVTNRHACKKFNGEKIPQKDLEYILDCARLAPSSYGLEQWKFLVVQNNELKQKLLQPCFNQPQITTASDVVILLGRNDVKPGTVYLEKCLDRFGEARDAMKPIIEGSLNKADDNFYKSWVNKQCYIAATHIMLSAISLGVDSCPMEGFSAKDVEEVLELDKNFFVSLVVPLGYRASEPRPKKRWPLHEVVEYR